jgi:hypothetical protein
MFVEKYASLELLPRVFTSVFDSLRFVVRVPISLTEQASTDAYMCTNGDI